MATVTHGRRKGQYRSPGNGASSFSLPRQTLVIPAKEWARITENLSGFNRDEQAKTMRQQEKELLHQKSKAMVKNWQNTIEGQRLKKLEARKLREEKEEGERVKIDMEEAKYQAEQRKKAIEKAKMDLYYQTDRVKKFHGALLLSEVLREREAQIHLKKNKEERVKERDNRYDRMMEEERRKGILQEMMKTEKQLAAQAEVSKFQIRQAMDRHKQKQQERQSALDEQKKLEDEAKEYHMKEKELEEKKSKEKLVYRRTLEDSLVEKNALLAEKKRMDELEEKEIQLFADAKKKMVQMRKDKEIELFRQFQEGQNRMTESLEQYMKSEKSDEDERIAQAVAEREAKRKAEEMEKIQKRAEMQSDIHRHRVQMINENERKHREEVERDRQLLKKRMIQDQKFHAQQLDKYHKGRKDAKQLLEFHKTQTAEREASLALQSQADEEYNQQNLDLLHLEEEQFQNYTQKVINEAKARGANTKPLEKAAVKGSGGGHGPIFEGKGGVRPSYMTMDSTGVQMPCYQSKNKGALVNTQKRIGFNW